MDSIKVLVEREIRTKGEYCNHKCYHFRESSAYYNCPCHGHLGHEVTCNLQGFVTLKKQTASKVLRSAICLNAEQE